MKLQVIVINGIRILQVIDAARHLSAAARLAGRIARHIHKANRVGRTISNVVRPMTTIAP